MLPYALSIFTGAFLLFQVQPLIGKYILPWFGGGPGVWTTCLLFFQTVLLGGYAYAHFSSRHLKPRQQGLLHLVLLGLALVLLPIVPSESWKSHLSGDPILHILLLLTACIGLPYFVLSSTGPLMQQWFSLTNPGVSPYRLYALSNVGSLLALLSYPFFFEWRFSRHTQATLWAAGLCVFVLCCGYCAWQLRRRAPAENPGGMPDPAATPSDGERTSPLDRLLWFSLPAIASILLLATTNKLCQEVAVVPFLWVLPLSLYLLSFILCFDHPRWYRRPIFVLLLVVGIAVVCHLLAEGNSAPLSHQITGYTLTLFVACMVCHGELFRLRPPPRRLTSYFLSIAAGGALGGFLVAVVAPLVFNEYWELQAGYWALTYFLGVLCYRHRSPEFPVAAGVGLLVASIVIPILRLSVKTDPGLWSQFEDLYHNYFGGSKIGSAVKEFYLDHWPWLAFAAAVFAYCFVDVRRRRWTAAWQPSMVVFLMFGSMGCGVIFLVQMHRTNEADGNRARLSASRNFYGTLKVFEYDSDSPEGRYYSLLNGAITHGIQFEQMPQAAWPTSYYAETSGVGLAIRHLPDGPRRIGLVGLGTGTLAAHGRAGDYLRIYEINPAVRELALGRFSYIRHCPAKVDIVLGDARLSMEQELAAGQPQQFDLLALDAFSSDAIPVHLLTREAFATYLRQLKPDGVIAVHTSNRYLNLRPVVEDLARDFGLKAAVVSDDDEKDWWVYRTTWILVTRNQALLDNEDIRNATDKPELLAKKVGLWTDDHASLYEILK
ncbi:MAG TPA: fused MFS/spermidine synthase [Opitutaceae bacterium]|nr:fused MFS/spermidine synthase [Opitutaceae bacterium]